MLLVDQRLDLRGLRPGLGRGRGHEGGEELLHALRRLGHLVLQLPGGEVRLIQQPRLLGADLRQPLDRAARIVRIAALGSRPASVEQLLADGAAGEPLQRRLLRRVLDGQDPPVVETARLGGFRRRVEIGGRQTREVRPVGDDERGVLGRAEQLIAELRAERGVLLVQLLQPRLVGLREPGAGHHELLIRVLDEPARLRVEAQIAAALVERFDPREQLRVERDRVLVGRDLRRHLLLELLQRVVGVRARQRVEDELGPEERLAALLERDERVLEAGRRRVVGDRVDLGEMLPHAFLERRSEVCVLDPVERRRLERQRARCEQRVGRRRRSALGLVTGRQRRHQGGPRADRDGQHAQRHHSQHSSAPRPRSYQPARPYGGAPAGRSRGRENRSTLVVPWPHVSVDSGPPAASCASAW